jgi:glutaconate CoA-transferase subunit B
MVAALDYRTTVGYGEGPGDRERLGFRGRGPTAVITDLGVLEPDPDTCELTLTQIHDGVEIEQVIEATGWELKVIDSPVRTPSPTAQELTALRELTSR